jgi:hypothetical protein
MAVTNFRLEHNKESVGTDTRTRPEFLHHHEQDQLSFAGSEYFIVCNAHEFPIDCVTYFFIPQPTFSTCD